MTPSEVITAAYREANFKDIGSTPSTAEAAEALVLLQSIVDGLFGYVLGTRLRPWPIPTNQRTANTAARYPASPGDTVSALQARDYGLPPPNVRLLMANTAVQTVYLQDLPGDGALVEYIDRGHSAIVTLDGNGAYIGLTGSTTTVQIDPADTGRNAPRRWVYRADYGAWQEIVALTTTQTDDMPFPAAFDDYFVTALAIRLSPRFGSEPRQVTLLRYKQDRDFIAAQWQQSAPSVGVALGVPTSQTYNDRADDSGFATGLV